MESASIIIPAFNEEKSIEKICRACVEALRDREIKFEIIVVDDGSVDNTAACAEKCLENYGRVIRHAENLGSGMALRTGLGKAKMDLAIFVPADFQFDPCEIPGFVEAAADADVVIGCRGRKRTYGVRRKLQSSVYLRLVNFLFDQDFRDVNWVQMWRMATAGQITLLSKGVFMQQEMLDRARLKGLRIVQIPSEFHRRTQGLAKGSGAATILRTIHELIRYRFFYRSKNL